MELAQSLQTFQLNNSSEKQTGSSRSGHSLKNTANGASANSGRANKSRIEMEYQLDKIFQNLF